MGNGIFGAPCVAVRVFLRTRREPRREEEIAEGKFGA
jgi:hypothetical protein